MDTKDRKNFNYTKLRFTGDYQYEPEEEQEQASKKFNKKEPPKKPAKDDWEKFNEKKRNGHKQ